MKKLFLLLSLVVAVCAAQAQVSVTTNLLSPAASGTHVTDTITNTGVVTMRSAIIKGSPNQTTVGITFIKISGTVAGTATLQGSIDGVNWYTASTTTYTVTDVATQSTSWALTGAHYAYYGVSVTGSGTSSYTVQGKVFTRNPK